VFMHCPSQHVVYGLFVRQQKPPQQVEPAGQHLPAQHVSVLSQQTRLSWQHC
jgi:hypothetical protein